MYLFKIEKKNEFLGGIKINWLAKEIAVSYNYLAQVFNAKRTCSGVLASLLMVKLKPNEDIEEYFIKKEK